MNDIKVVSPTRVDLAGGTLDLWPLYNFVEGAVTVNLAINVCSHVTISKRADSKIEICSLDLSYQETFDNLQVLLDSKNPNLILFQKILSVIQPRAGFRMTTRSDSPVGAGLGGSSSLVISIIKALSKFDGILLGTAHDVVNMAHNIEAGILNTPTGTQDYYPAFSGGLNILNYGAKGIQQEVLSVKKSQMADFFLLVYTGRSHHSGINNFEVLKSAVAKDQKVLAALKKLKKISNEVALVCRAQSWDKLHDLFAQEYESRIQLTEHFSSPEIKEIKKISDKMGKSSVKICGAGGGGCVLIWTQSSVRSKIESECQAQGFQIMNSQPVDLDTIGF